MRKNILITAATSTIGKEILDQFSKYDYNIYLVSSNKSAIKTLKLNDKIVMKEIGNVFLYDLTKEDSALKLFEEIQKNEITIDYLFNYPCIEKKSSLNKLFLKNYFVEIDEIIKNLSTFSQLIANDMFIRKSGKIINIGNLVTSIPEYIFRFEKITDEKTLENYLKLFNQFLDSSNVTILSFNEIESSDNNPFF